MKRLLCVLLVLLMLFSETAMAFAAEADDPAVMEEDLSGEVFEDVHGDGSAYQIASIQPLETGDGYAAAYIAETDTFLTMTIVSDDNGAILAHATLPVSAGSGVAAIRVDLNTLPQYYEVFAALQGGEVFNYQEKTRAYEEFMTIGSDDADFRDRVILDYGDGFDGTENFAVVSEDVKVVYVETIEDVDIVGEVENDADFTLMDGAEYDSYQFQETLSDDVVSDLKKGDKLLILPMDDVNDAKTIVVGKVQEEISLFGEGEDTVTVTPAETQPEMEEFFDFVRIHVEVEADTDDLDTSDAEVELVENEEEPTVDLMGTLDLTKKASKSYTMKKSYSCTHKEGDKTYKGKLTVQDTFTLSATIKLKIDYSLVKLKSITATAELKASNKFVIDAQVACTKSGEIYVGTIPAGVVSGVTFKIPVYLTYYVKVEGKFNFTATQTATTKVTATYKNGKYSTTTTKSATCNRELTVEAGLTARLGIKGTVEASLSIIALTAGVSGEVGIQVSGTVKEKWTNGNKVSTFSGDLSVYVQPGFKITFLKKTLVSKTWSRSTSRLAGLNVSFAVYYTMTDLAEMEKDAILQMLETNKDKGVTINIGSITELELLSSYVSEGKPTAGLEFIINTQDSTWNLSNTWIPIGNDTYAFQGIFDGRGITLDGLTINSNDSNVGFFGKLVGAEVHDLALTNASVTGQSNVGVLVGQADDSTSIYDVSVSGFVSGIASVGGIAGDLSRSSLINSCSTAQINGSGNIGGLVGNFSYSDVRGQIANCYFAGTIDTTAAVYGTICGTLQPAIIDDAGATADSTIRYTALGINYCYYLDHTDADAVGDGDGTTVTVWSVTEEQAKGKDGEPIAEESIANTNKLVDALNNWYAQYGAYLLEGEISVGIPDANVLDYYNRWFKYDDETCLPYFKGQTKYPLTVHYVYEDGSKVAPSTTVYFALGAYFDFDPIPKNGYYTNVDETGYTGYMTPDGTQNYEWQPGEKEGFSGLEYRIVYIKETAYSTNLSIETPAVSGSIYKITNEADLLGLAAYVAAGGNTKGVTFEQLPENDELATIALTAQISIGTEDHPFCGTYIGNYSTISGSEASALFAYTDGAEIRELNLTNGSLIADAKKTKVISCSAPKLIGSAEDCTIDQCSANSILIDSMTGGKLMNSQSAAGKLVSNATNAVIENCYVKNGDLVGNMTGGNLANCYYTGSIGNTTDTVTESLHKAEANNIPNLIAALNAWVAATTSTAYLTWMEDITNQTEDEPTLSSETIAFPVFGAPYENWLTEFRMADGKVEFVFNNALNSGDVVYLTVYADNGQMLSIHPITEGMTSLTVDSKAAYAKCFSLNEDATPQSEAIRTVS